MNRTSFPCGNRKRYHNTEHRTLRHLTGQNVGRHYMQTCTKKI